MSSASIAGSERSFPRSRSCCFLVAVIVKLTRCRSPIAFVAKSAKPLAGLIHRVEDRAKHGRLIGSARFIDERIDLDAGAPFKKADQFERDDHDDCGHCSGRKQSRAACHADGGDYPDAGSTGQSADAAAVVNDQSGAEEANALHDIRRHLALIRAAVSGQHSREQREKRRAQTDEQVSAYAGRSALVLSLQADDSLPTRMQQSAGGWRR